MKDWLYEFKLESERPENSKIYSFVSSDGVNPKKGFRDSELIIADEFRPKESEDVLVAEPGYGFLGVVLADKVSKGEVLVVNSSDRADQLTQLNLERNDISNAETEKAAFYSEIERKFDNAVYSPKSYEPVDLVKNRISDIIGLLRPSGCLYISGKKTDGINRYRDYLKDSEGKLEKVEQRGSQKLYRYTKTENSRPEKPEIEKSFDSEVRQVKMNFSTCDGLFSPGKIDEGTRLLMENLDLSDKEEVLDVACGYGALGIFAAKKFGCKVSLTDDSSLATFYAERNLEKNKAEHYQLRNRDCLDGFNHEKFDAIISNPPTHQGSKITDEIFTQSFKKLKSGGQLIIVYNKNMRFQDKLNEIFHKTRILDEKDNYRILEASKN